MTERKQKKLMKDVTEAEEILSELVSTPQGGYTAAEIQAKLSKLLPALHKPDTASIAIYAIAEVLRITAPKNVLGASETYEYFRAVLQNMPARRLDLATFIHCRIPALFKDTGLISEFFSIFSTLAHNRDSLQDMLVIFMEEVSACRSFAINLIGLKPFPVAFFNRVVRFIDLQALPENAYVTLFTNCIEKMTIQDVRIVRCRERLVFVQSAIRKFPAEIERAYSNDKDKRIRAAVARHCISTEVFMKLLNDHDEDVRIALVSKLTWESMRKRCIARRVLDKCFKVRELLYAIYDTGLRATAGAEIYSQTVLQGGRLNFVPVEENRLNTPSKKDELGADVEIMKEFVKNMLEGCLTAFREEYITILKRSCLSLAYLYEVRDLPGASVFLKTLDIPGYESIPREFREFCLGYIYKGVLSHENILECLRDDVFAVLKHIKSPEQYFNILLDKARTSQNLHAVEEIVELIRPQLGVLPCQISEHSLNTHDTLPLASDTIVTLGDLHSRTPSIANGHTPNNYFINAHTKCSEVFVEDQFGDYNYAKLYFLIYQAKSDVRVRRALIETALSLGERIKLLLYLDDAEFLQEFVPVLLSAKLDVELRQRILKARALNSSLIYFLATGMVTIKNPHFFIRCVKLAAHGHRKEELKRIFSNYMSALDQHTYDLFYSICWELKEHVLSDRAVSEDCCAPAAESKDDAANSGKHDDASEPVQNKLKLSKNDQMLHAICDLIMEMRQGALLDVKVDLVKLGFAKLTDNELAMLRYNQVQYE